MSMKDTKTARPDIPIIFLIVGLYNNAPFISYKLVKPEPPFTYIHTVFPGNIIHELQDISMACTTIQ